MEMNMVRGIFAGLLIFVVVILLNRWPLYREAAKGKRLGIGFGVLIVVLSIFFMIWPYD